MKKAFVNRLVTPIKHPNYGPWEDPIPFGVQPDGFEIEDVPEMVPDGWEPYSEKPLNEKLEEAFLSVLPKHLGQPYLINDLIVQIGTLKQVVTDYNRLGLYDLSKGMIANIPLPDEMKGDRDALLELYP